MTKVDTNQAPYYDDFDRSKMYSKLLYQPNKPLQNRELNVMQQILQEDVRNLGDAFFKEGDIISGIDFDLTKNTKEDTIAVNIHQGFVYLDGLATWTPGGKVTIPNAGRVYVNAHIQESVVSSDEDPTLLDPAIGAPSVGASGADRLKREVEFTTFIPDTEEGVNDTSQGAGVFIFQDGSLFVKPQRPGISNIMDVLAQRTMETNGSYRVNGLNLVVDAEQPDEDNVQLTVTDGVAYVRGYRVEKPASTRMKVAVSKETRSITNEPAFYDEKTQRVRISALPVSEVNSVTASVLTRQNVTRTSGLEDPLPDGTYGSGIVAVKNITSPKGIVYGTLDNPQTSAHPADFTVKAGGAIKWKSGSQVIPAAGNTYQVEYLYTRVMVAGVDYKLTVVDNELDDNGFKATYIDFNGINGAKPSTMPGYSQVSTSYNFFLARRDLISVTPLGEFVITKGDADIISKVQIKNASDDSNLPVGWVTVYPNSTQSQSNDWTVTNLTFAELQKMQARVENLERNVAKMAQDVSAAQGQDPLTLRGIFSDGFATLEQADTAIFGDINLGDEGNVISDSRWTEGGRVISEAAHNFSNASITLGYANAVDQGQPGIDSTTKPDGSLTELMTWQGQMVSGNYQNEVAISQSIATGTININPYAVYETQQGSMRLNPAIDNFVDEKKVTINNVYYKNLKVYRYWAHGGKNWTKDSQYIYDNMDNINWTNTNADWINSAGSKGAKKAPGGNGRAWSGVGKGSIVESGGRKVDESMKDFARTIDVQFDVKGLRPMADDLAVYWDDNGVAGSMPLSTKPLSPSTAGSMPGTIRADATGRAKGKFKVPANQPQGNHSIVLQTKGTENPTNKATATYVSAASNRTITDIINTTFITAELVDPLAESFRLQGDRVVTGVDLFFQSKDPKVPVQVQIRPLADGGLPSSKILGEAMLMPSEVKTSSNGTVATRFSFDNPVMIQSGLDYAFVVVANSNNYNVFYAQMGKRKLGKDNSVLVSNPYEGVMFSSANAISWTVHQDADLKFNLLTAKFREGDSTILFKPWEIKPDKNGVRKDIGVLKIPTMTDAEKSAIKMQYRVVLDSDGSAAGIESAPWRDIDTSQEEIDLGGYIRIIQLRIIFTSTKYTSPFVSLDTVSLLGVLTDLKGTYVGKTVDMSEDDMFFNNVELTYEKNTPTGTNVTPKISVGQKGTEFIWDTPEEMKKKGAIVNTTVSRKNVDGWVRVTHVISLPASYPNSSVLGLQKGKVRLDLDSEMSFTRPQVRALSTIFLDK